MSRNEELIQAYLAGETGRSLAPRFGISMQRVYQIIKRAGVERSRGYRTDGAKARTPSRVRLSTFWTAEAQATLERIAGEGGSFTDAARALGTTKGAVAGRSRRTGIAFRGENRGSTIPDHLRRLILATAARYGDSAAARSWGVSRRSILNWRAAA